MSWIDTFTKMSHESRVMTIVEDGSTLDALLAEAAALRAETPAPEQVARPAPDGTCSACGAGVDDVCDNGSRCVACGVLRVADLQAGGHSVLAHKYNDLAECPVCSRTRAETPAPADLVALVQEIQRVVAAEAAQGMHWSSTQQQLFTRLLTWTPVPVDTPPRVTPSVMGTATTTSGPGPHDGSYWDQSAPPQPAGAMPALRLDDVVSDGGDAWHIFDADDLADWQARSDEIVAIYRTPLWRRDRDPQEGR